MAAPAKPAPVVPAAEPATPEVTTPAPVSPAASDTTPKPAVKTQPAAVPSAPKPAPAVVVEKASPPPARPSNDLVTLTGATYQNVYVERVQTDGIIISYTPVQGGFAMTKIYFNDLSSEMRQKYVKQ